MDVSTTGPRPLAARLARNPAFWIGTIGLLVAIPLGRTLLRGPPLPRYGELPAFSLLDQDERAFDNARMAGKAWVANFVFTSCPTVCPLLTSKMSEVQKAVHRLGNVNLVSFSVDPQTDTPQVLREYGARYRQDPARWSFVTGAVDAIEATVVGGFKIAVDREKRADDPALFDIVHGEHFVLVDSEGRIRGYYPSDEPGMARLLSDTARLSKAGGS